MHCNNAQLTPLDLNEVFTTITEHWRPRLVASLNGQSLKAVKFQGEFPWHTHHEEDELFLVVQGVMRIETREHRYTLGAGQFMVIPRGVEHRTAADRECHALLFEPMGVVNTGDAPASAFTAPTDRPL